METIGPEECGHSLVVTLITGQDNTIWGRCNGKMEIGICHFLEESRTFQDKRSLSLSSSLSFAEIPLVKLSTLEKEVGPLSCRAPYHKARQ